MENAWQEGVWQEGETLNLEVSLRSPPSNQQAPGAPQSRGALPAWVVVSEGKDPAVTTPMRAARLPGDG